MITIYSFFCRSFIIYYSHRIIVVIDVVVGGLEHSADPESRASSEFYLCASTNQKLIPKRSERHEQTTIVIGVDHITRTFPPVQ